MWIIFFNGVPSFWLVGDTTYRAGKRDCDVNIEDDKSVSRNHLVFSVGLTPVQHIDSDAVDEAERQLSPLTPAPLVLTDTSTYGTKVYPCGKTSEGDDGAADTTGALHNTSLLLASDVGLGNRTAVGASRGSQPMTAAAGETQRLTKNEPFTVPNADPLWHTFKVVLGNHGATLHFVWVPVHVLVEDVESEWHTKLEHALNRCGAFILHETPAHTPPPALTTTASHAEETCPSYPPTSSPLLEATAARRLALYRRVDLLVSSTVQPSAVVVALLCRGVPIVTPAFFLDVRDRATAQVPLPDVQRYIPPLAGTFWEQLASAAAAPSGGTDEGETRHSQTAHTATTLMLPHPRRQRLLDGLTFVVFQAALYEEVAQYVACAGGHVLIDQTLLNAVNARTTQSAVQAFSARHQRHVVLYSQTEPLPFRECLTVLCDQQQLVCVEYADLVMSLFLVRPLTLDPFPSSQTTAAVEERTDSAMAHRDAVATHSTSTSARASGRRTDAQPLFPELYEAHVGHDPHADEVGGAAGHTSLRRDPRRHVDSQGWISRDVTEVQHDAAAGRSIKRPRTHGGREAADAADSRDTEGDDQAMFVPAQTKLPPYPCFYVYAGPTVSAHAPPRSGYTITQTKVFHKQTLPAPVPLAELMDVHAATLGAQLLTARVPAVDSDDLIADRGHTAGRRGAEAVHRVSTGGAPFNAFDNATLNSVNRKKGTARRAAKAPRRNADAVTAAQAEPQMMATTPAPARQVQTPPPSPPPPRTEHIFNVFDIEGIF